MVEISASVLTVEKENAIHTFYELETAKIDYFHIDVMDGKFVEKNNFDLMKEYALTISHISNVGLDVHFMVENVEQAIHEFIDLSPKIITFHIEAIKDKEKILKIIKELQESNIKIGIAISPDTNIDEVKEYIQYVHMILVMTVVPGKGGQAFIPEMLEKIESLKKYVNENDLEIDIEVDGGINEKTSKEVRKVGADILVAGNYIISSENKADSVKKLKE